MVDSRSNYHVYPVEYKQKRQLENVMFKNKYAKKGFKNQVYIYVCKVSDLLRNVICLFYLLHV